MNGVFRQDKDLVEVGGTQMINFAKWTSLHVCMRDVFRYKPPNIPEYRQRKADALAYLEQQLKGISMGSRIDDSMEARSHALEQKEEVMRQLRIPELSAVGMR